MKASSAREAWKRARTRVRADRGATPRIIPGGFTGYAVESSPFWLGLLVVLGVIAEVSSMVSAVNSRLVPVSLRVEDQSTIRPQAMEDAFIRGDFHWREGDAVSVAAFVAGSGVTILALIVFFWAYRGFIAQVVAGAPFSSGFRRFSRWSALAVIGGAYLPLISDAVVSFRAVQAYPQLSSEAVNSYLERNSALESFLGEHPEQMDLLTGWHLYPQIEIPFWPLGALILLGVLNAVFAYGRRLEEDTEGLV